ncbi:polysialic acid transporter [Acinetobacter sp. Ac_3412]|uniref:ABC transporter permease n=1 Tax=Acinetobacter TaxID=469 RepID=UPI00148FDD08|nr:MULTISPECIES: ABC transporter permease [Acinetobacter]MDO3666224.1 ABC transporter permease [Acinetobacter higginsii]NNP75047.1 polysialic acid transporter [Acinetobacter sp. Ac_3412]
MDEQTSSLKGLPRLKPRGGLQVMYAAVRALFLRELQTRFGQFRLGYFWILLEPALHIGFLLILFGRISHTIPGMEFEVFLVNGIIPFFLFRTTISQSLGAVQANQGLFSYRPVKPIDTLIARSFLELFLYFIAYLFFNAILLWLGFHISFDAVPKLLGYWILLYALSFSLSLVFIVIGSISRELNKFIPMLFLMLYFLSAVIYTIHFVPAEYQQYLLWNPVIHILESMRHAVAPNYPLVNGISLTYVAEWIIGSLFLGLLLYKRFEQQMVKSK